MRIVYKLDGKPQLFTMLQQKFIFNNTVKPLKIIHFYNEINTFLSIRCVDLSVRRQCHIIDHLYGSNIYPVPKGNVSCVPSK